MSAVGAQRGLARPTTVAEMRARFERFATADGTARALAFSPRADDVFIATYPKCGTTWLQQIVHGLRTGGSMDFDEITAVVPWLELAHDLGIDAGAAQVAAPRAFKTHLDRDRVPKGARYVYAVRDPADVLVSLYRFLDGWFFEAGSIDIETFARDHFMAGTRSGGYWAHVASWWPHRGAPDVLWLCYEDIKADLPGCVRRVAGFIGVDADEALVERVVHQSSIDFMRAHAGKFDDHLVRAARDASCGIPPGGTSAKVRSGEVGAHRAELSGDVRAALDARWRETLGARFGLESYEALRASVAREAGGG